MNKQLKIGAIGCSSIGKRVIFPAINESNICNLKIIGSRSIKKAKNTASIFHCKEFGSYEEVIEDKEIDIVYVSLPIALQEFWVLKAIRSGKHVLCEKSISPSFSSLKKIWKECQKNNVKVLEGFSFRHHPQHIFVKKMLEEKKLGELHNISTSFVLPIMPSVNDFRFNKKLGGGILNDVGCYIINSARYFFNDEPISVKCELIRNTKYDIDVRGTIYLSFKNKNTCFGLIGYENTFSSDYRIFCNNGIIISDKAYNPKNSEKTQINIKTKIIKIKRFSPVNQSRLMIEEFCKNITSDKHELESEFVNQGKVMEAARISNKKNKIVFLREFN